MSAKKSFSWHVIRKTKCLGSSLLTLLAAILLISTAACGQAAAKPSVTPAATLQPGDSPRTLTVGGLERTYILHIPPGLDSLRPMPVVFVFHGYTENAVYIQTMTSFNEIADKNSFIVIYPNGINQSWNASGCCGEAVNKNIDDFAFVRQMLAELGTIIRVDPKRIYAAGFSNGAIFSYRLACEMSDTFAAIAPVEGWLLTNPCQPKQAVAVVDVHGSNDAYEGTTSQTLINGVNTDVIYPPVEQAIATWVKLDGCTGNAQVEKQGIVTHTVHASCKAGTAVEQYVIEGGSHTWPNMYAFPTASTQMIWDFFKAHPKQ
ncbi:MAG: PHB depolymerase family esterase [Anaerolineales bacterium]|jgi:polyhydroxybutyrate depolymerase